MTKDEAKRIQETLCTPGWHDVLKIMEDMSKDAESKVMHLLSSSPEKLTGRTAIKYGARRKALLDLKEELYEALKICSQSNGTEREVGGESQTQE